MSVAARISAFAVLALLGGVGTVYTPVPTFTAVAVIFALGLWAFAGSRRPSLALPRISGGATRKARGTPVTMLVSGYLFFFWLGLIVPLAFYSSGDETSVTATQAAATGSLRNQVLISTFGLVGALFLPAAIRRFDRAFQWLVIFWVVYMGWAAVSLIWSVNPVLTARNVAALALVSVGCFGLGAGFYGALPNGRDLFLRHVFWAGVLSALVILLPLPFHFERFDLLSPSGRVHIGGERGKFAVRPVMCAMLVLIATPILGVRRWQKRDFFWVAIFVFTLLALRERGPVLWGILALGALYLYYKTRIQDRVLQVGSLFVIGVGTYIFYTQNVFGSVFGSLAEYLTRGSVETTANLTGRVPLWEALVGEVAQRPWLGTGYATFWGSLDILQAFGVQNLQAPSAHNGYLEELLNTGVMGLVLLLAFCLATLTIARREARRGDPLGWLVILYMVFFLLLNLTNAVTQEYFEPVFVIILVALGLMASRPTTDPPTSPIAPPTAGSRTHWARPPR